MSYVITFDIWEVRIMSELVCNLILTVISSFFVTIAFMKKFIHKKNKIY